MGEVEIRRDWHLTENEWTFDLREDGRMVGMAAAIRLDGGAVWLAELWVRPGFRRRGLGAQLAAAVLAALGDRDMTLSAEPFEFDGASPAAGGEGMDAAVLAGWYARRGFAPCGPGPCQACAGLGLLAPHRRDGGPGLLMHRGGSGAR